MPRLLTPLRFPLGWSVPLAAILAAWTFAPAYGISAESASGDLASAAGYARDLASGARGIVSPHFLFPLLVILLEKIRPEPGFLRNAASLMTMAQAATAGILVLALGRGLDRARDGDHLAFAGVAFAVLPISLLLAGPINLPGVPFHNLHAGYFNPNNFHNPSSNLLKPFAVVLFVGALPWLSGRPRLTSPWLLALVHGASLIVKPSLSIVLVPALALVALARRAARRPVDLQALTIAFVFPFLAVASMQYLFTFTGWAGSPAPRTIEWRPFAVILRTTPASAILPKLLLSTAFPSALVLLFGRRILRRASTQLAWTSFLFSVLLAYALIEGSPRGPELWHAGNFWWSVQISLFLLFLDGLDYLLGDAEISSLPRSRRAVLLSLWSLHLTGGLLWYLATVEGVATRWR